MLPELRLILGTSIKDISYGLTIRAVCSSLGAVMFGFLLTRMNKHVTLGVASLTAAVTTLTLPFFTSVNVFMVFQALVGVAASGIDICSNSWLTDLWSKDFAPYLQGLYFSYACGATLSPLLVGPFLSDHSNETLDIVSIYSSNYDSDRNNSIRIPFAITTSLQILAAAFLLIAYCIKRIEKANDAANLEASDYQPTMSAIPSSRYYYQIIGMASLIIFTEVWSESSIFVFVETFAEGCGYSKSSGAYMTSAFTASYMISRGVAAFGATNYSSMSIYYSCLTIALIGNAILLVSPGPHLWVSIIFLGLGLGAVIPTVFVSIGEGIDVSSNVYGILTLISNIASIVNPLIVGTFIEQYPMIFVHAILVGIALQLITVFSLYSVLGNHRPREQIEPQNVSHER